LAAQRGRAQMADDNVKILTDAGLTRPEKLTQQDKKLLDSLSKEEVKTLLQIKKKLGDQMVQENWKDIKFF
jgi:hypothetical protein